jgi:hypothetical protein
LKEYILLTHLDWDKVTFKDVSWDTTTHSSVHILSIPEHRFVTKLAFVHQLPIVTYLHQPPRAQVTHSKKMPIIATTTQ